MSKNEFILSPEITTRIPGIRILLFTLTGINQNDSKLRDACEGLLKTSWLQCGQLFTGDSPAYANVQSHPQLSAWRDCFKSLGISVKKHVCSAESLAKRASKDPANPRSINPLVDFYNAISVKHLVPFGAFDLCDLQGKCMSLRMTRAGDTFEALDGNGAEEVPSGEAAYICEPNIVITRHINYRQSKFALVGDATQEVVMMAELLPSVTDEMMNLLVKDIKEQCWTLFNQKVHIQIINNPSETTTY